LLCDAQDAQDDDGPPPERDAAGVQGDGEKAATEPGRRLASRAALSAAASTLMILDGC